MTAYNALTIDVPVISWNPESKCWRKPSLFPTYPIFLTQKLADRSSEWINGLTALKWRVLGCHSMLNEGAGARRRYSAATGPLSHEMAPGAKPGVHRVLLSVGRAGSIARADSNCPIVNRPGSWNYIFVLIGLRRCQRHDSGSGRYSPSSSVILSLSRWQALAGSSASVTAEQTEIQRAPARMT